MAGLQPCLFGRTAGVSLRSRTAPEYHHVWLHGYSIHYAGASGDQRRNGKAHGVLHCPTKAAASPGVPSIGADVSLIHRPHEAASYWLTFPAFHGLNGVSCLVASQHCNMENPQSSQQAAPCFYVKLPGEALRFIGPPCPAAPTHVCCRC